MRVLHASTGHMLATAGHASWTRRHTRPGHSGTVACSCGGAVASGTLVAGRACVCGRELRGKPVTAGDPSIGYILPPIFPGQNRLLPPSFSLLRFIS
jgi:hypothetical protein